MQQINGNHLLRLVIDRDINVRKQTKRQRTDNDLILATNHAIEGL